MSEGHITVVCGNVGGGKTYWAVRKIARYVARGGRVWTNIDIRMDPWYNERYQREQRGFRSYVRRLGGVVQDGQVNRISCDRFDDFYTIVPRGSAKFPSLVVLDEALEGYDSLDQMEENKGRLRRLLSFVRHCRKENVDLVYIVQTFSELNVRIRTKATEIIDCMDMAKFRVPVLNIPYPFPWYFCFRSRQPKTGLVDGREMCRKDSDVYGSYDTSQIIGMVRAMEGDGVACLRREKSLEWLLIAGCLLVSPFF